PRPDDQGGLAALLRPQEAARLDGRRVAAFERQPADGGQVADGAVGVLAGDDDLLHGPRPGQHDRFGLNAEGGRLADEFRLLPGLGGGRRAKRGGGDEKQCDAEREAAADEARAGGCGNEHENSPPWQSEVGGWRDEPAGPTAVGCFFSSVAVYSGGGG